MSRRVKKLADGTEESVVKVTLKQRKPPKKPIVFKAGKWNPETQLLTTEDELERFGHSESGVYTCCLRCNNRNAIRSIENESVNLLRALVTDQKNIPSLTDKWSVDCDHLTPLNMILEKKNTNLLEVIFKLPTNNPADTIMNSNGLNQFYYVYGRAKVKPYLLQKVDTGTVSD